MITFQVLKTFRLGATLRRRSNLLIRPVKLNILISGFHQTLGLKRQSSILCKREITWMSNVQKTSNVGGHMWHTSPIIHTGLQAYNNLHWLPPPFNLDPYVFQVCWMSSRLHLICILCFYARIQVMWWWMDQQHPSQSKLSPLPQTPSFLPSPWVRQSKAVSPVIAHSFPSQMIQ